MTRVRETSDNDLPLVDRRARSGTVLRILLLALVLIAAAAAFVYFKNSLENEIVLGILGVLAMMGIFFWFRRLSVSSRSCPSRNRTGLPAVSCRPILKAR